MPKAKKAPAPSSPAPAESAAEWAPTEALRPWANNPRRNDDAVAAVVASIRRFGFGAPILARRANGEIIAGHTRWKAAQQLGLDRVPVRFLDLDPVDAHLLALADNRLGEEASWNDEMLSAVLADLKAHDADLAATGFSDQELAKLLADAAGGGEPNEVPEPELSRADELRAKWGTELGQLWTIESRSAPGQSHRLLCADSTRADDVERLMGVERAACMWTDPPYGVAYVGRQASKLTIANDTLTGRRLFELLSASFVAADTRALSKGAAVYVAHPAGAASLQFLLAFEHAGWRVHQSLVWVKDKMVLGHSDYHYTHEPILLGYTPASAGRRGRGGEGWYGDNAQTSVFEVPRPKSSDEHPTMKPPELVAAMVRNSAPPGGTVYEPFSGSGSTIGACEATGRVCRAIELEPKYVAVALERMSAMGLTAEKNAAPPN
ncbi:MAG: DNA modification methylase [Solirubrobacteraceae bacterium]